MRKKGYPREYLKRLGIFLLIFSMSGSVSLGEEIKPIKPSPRDKCPVCGMFVAKYPDWVAAIRFRDGGTVFFDGAKDMFKYYLELRKYNPSRKQADIEAVQVTDYYNLTATSGLEAFYVIGSDVYGPMGREFVPFAREEDALGFMKDHQGKSMVRFKEVTREKIKGLE